MNNLILAFGLLLVLVGCGQNSNTEQTDNNAPGPITETDRSRYNINSNEESMYGTMDSLMGDSIRRDSINK